MAWRSLLLAATIGAMALMCGCANNESPRPPGNPLLRGYTPWAAPATDTLVDLWYLGCTPEEFDCYWLTREPPRRHNPDRP
jgi:hypothetical protein